MADLATIEVDRRDDAVVAVVHGDVDLSNIQVVRAQLDAVLTDGHAHHIIDLTHTTFIDSVGIHLLFSIADNLRTRRQELRIVIPAGSSVARVLRLTDVQSVIPMFSDVASALKAPDEFSL